MSDGRFDEGPGAARQGAGDQLAVFLAPREGSLVRLHIRRTRLLIETSVNAATPAPATPAGRRIRRETPDPQAPYGPPTDPRNPFTA